MLNVVQLDTLGYLCRQSGPVLVDHLDGRVVRALKNRGLLEVRGEWASPTPAGREARERAAAPSARRKRQRTITAAGARAQSILKAVDELEQAMPIDAEVELPTFRAYGDDIVTGLRQFARQMDRVRGS
jgi:hypothetical protein